jgi:hypothetical protein
MTGSLHHAWNDYTLSPDFDKKTWPMCISISQARTCPKQNASQSRQRMVPENSVGWLDFSPDHPQRIVIARGAYFDKDISSALAFISIPLPEPFPSALIKTSMNSKLLTTLNHQLSTKLDLLPIMETHHPFSMKNQKP